MKIDRCPSPKRILLISEEWFIHDRIYTFPKTMSNVRKVGATLVFPILFLSDLA